MNIRHLYISAGVLAVLAIITSVLTRTSSAPLLDERVGSNVVDPANLRDTAKIVVETDGEKITLVNDEEKKAWVLEEKHNLPTSYSRISQLARNVSEAKLQRLVSENPDRIATLGFEGGDRIQFIDKLDNDIVAFGLGKETENGRQFLRFYGEEKAFLVNTTFYIDSNLDSWLEKKLVSFEANDVTAITTTLQNGDKLSATRDNADSEWATDDSLPEKKILNQSSIGQIASKFAGLSFTATADKDGPNVVAARENSHQFGFQLNNGKSYQFRIGRQPEVKIEKEVEKEDENGEKTTEMEEEVVTPEGPVYFFISSSDAGDPVNEYMRRSAFEVSSYQFTSLPESLDDLISDAPEPVEEPPAPLLVPPADESP
tara:strand:+ start:936 stop:2051 length:1116 start_codon:yes stop_codon:yes gene_type:complete